MAIDLSEREWLTLADIADPEGCLLHDGETIESLRGKRLIAMEQNCFRLTEAGRQCFEARGAALVEQTRW